MTKVKAVMGWIAVLIVLLACMGAIAAIVQVSPG